MVGSFRFLKLTSRKCQFAIILGTVVFDHFFPVLSKPRCCKINLLLDLDEP